MTTQATHELRLQDPSLLLKVIDNLPISVWIKNKDLRFVLSNRQHCELIGVDEKDLIGRDVGHFIRDMERVAQSRGDDAKLLLEHTPISHEFVDTYKKDTARVVVISKTLVQDAGGEDYIVGVSVDITDVRRSEAQLRSITSNVPVGIMQFDFEGNLKFANLRAYELIAQSAFSENRLLHVLAKDCPGFPGERAEFEVLVEGKAGKRLLLVQSSGWANFDYDDSRSAVVSLVDITENRDLKDANQRITELNSELESSLKLLQAAQDEVIKKGRLEQLGQMTATIAHEIRNPLGSVQTSAFLLERKLGPRPDLDPLLKRIMGGVKRCDDIITQLLDFARTSELALKPGKLDTWLSELLQQEGERLPSALNIVFEPGTAASEVHFDSSRLSRAVINVVSNASEAMLGKPGMERANAVQDATLRVSTGLTARGIEIVFKDNGPGMTQEILSKIFEPLFTTKNFGTGLGVPAVERIMQQHGGGVDVWSEPGQGARFTLWWPGRAE